jgi:hypothetical protein
MSESRSNSVTDAEKQLVFDLMRERLFELFGPGGSFRITLGRATEDDAVFVATVADTIAWDAAAGLEAHRAVPAKRAAPVIDTEPKRDPIWDYVAEELLRRRTNEDSLDVVGAHTHAA